MNVPQQQNKVNAFVWVVLLFFALIVGFLGGLLLKNNNFNLDNVVYSSSVTKLSQCVKLISKHYVERFSADTLTKKALTGLLTQLDPHSVYLEKDALQEEAKEMQGAFDGIGVQFSIQKDSVVIVSVVDGGPSQLAGILPGDRIVSVNGKLLTGKKLTNDDVVKALRGNKGSAVQLGIVRRSSLNPLYISVVRAPIPIKSVEASYMLTTTVGFIKINRFAEQTYNEFALALKKLKEQGAVRLILDLRSNPGGYLNIAVQIANEFFDSNQLITYTQGAHQSTQRFFAGDEGAWTSQPLVVLIDEFSASASEIVAGAVQDYDRGLIVGNRSFGKGLVQEQFALFDGSELRLTVAHYYTPSGRNIQKPYGDSIDRSSYFLDPFLRRMGSPKALKQVDSLQFFTQQGRIVYGSGGITPDVVVHNDSLYNVALLLKLQSQNVLYDFAIYFADQDRLALQQCKTVEAIEQYMDSRGAIEQLRFYARQAGIRFTGSEFNNVRYIIDALLKANVAQNQLGDEAYYRFMQRIDPVVQTAIMQVNKLHGGILPVIGGTIVSN